MRITPYLTAILAFCAFYAHSAVDINAGQKKAAFCESCHGIQGNSTNPEWPRLAGQHSSYLRKQLHAFKEKTRENTLMVPVILRLNDQDIKNLAAYFAAQPAAVIPSSQQKTISLGEQLYRSGDINKHITPCSACHGPDGMGNAQAEFPVLRGQHAIYLAQQLEAFKKQRRHNAIMEQICAKMSDDDIQAIANYITTM